MGIRSGSARWRSRGSPAGSRGSPTQRVPQCVQPLTGCRRDRNDWEVGKPAIDQENLQFLGQLEDAIGWDQIDPRDDDEQLRDTQRLEHGGMFQRLGLDALIGGDDQQPDVDRRNAGQQVGDVALVPWCIDHGEDVLVVLQCGESEVHRDSASLLLGMLIGIDAGQRPHQRCLAVIDVPGYTDYGVPSSIW